MKALTLTQPWATLLVSGQKRIETRSWPTKHVGTLLIHAAKGYPGWAKEAADEWSRDFLGGWAAGDLPTGALIGSVDVTGCRRTEDVRHLITEKEREFGDYGDGRFAWGTTNPRRASGIVVCRGALGLWDVPADLLAEMNFATPEEG